MNNLGKSIVCGLAALFATTIMAAAPSSITAFVPMTMNYQGYLANPSTGAAYTDGIYDIQCRLYTVASGGTAIWGAQYSVYVKDGYFNIMLGDSSSSTIYSTVSGTGSTTYTKEQLWKALLDTSYNSLYLGVTPLQGPTHATIASPSEISPRQQLLTGPYAFRAQTAKYADRALSDFTVPGTLTASSLSFGGNSITLPYVKATNGTLILGYSSGNPQSSGPAITNAASYYKVGSYYGQNYSASNGDIYFGANSSKSFTFNTGRFAVTNSNLISLHSNYCDLNMSANNTQLSGSYTTVSSINTTTVTGNYVKVGSKYDVTLAPATNSYLYGQGKLSWTVLGGTSNYRPMIVKSYQVPISANSNSASLEVTDYPSSQWAAMMVGFETDKVSCPAPNAVRLAKGSGTAWQIRTYFSSSVTAAQNIVVHVLFIQKAFCDDLR